MSTDTAAILAEIDKVYDLPCDQVEGAAIPLLEKIQALLSTHAVIDKETASRTHRVLMANWVQCTDRLESETVLEAELSRITPIAEGE